MVVIAVRLIAESDQSAPAAFFRGFNRAFDVTINGYGRAGGCCFG